jgi:ribosomal protein S18 acetylase RimI-like enzyme
MGRLVIGARIRPITAEDVEGAARLVADVFGRYVAPLYVPEGVSQFLSYASREGFRQRLSGGHSGFVAESEGGELIGLVEIRDPCHISLLFVSGAHQRQGIGKELVGEAVAHCRGSHPDTLVVTVNASPNSVGAYRRLGFRPTGPEQEKNGIRFVPMAMSLPSPGGD